MTTLTRTGYEQDNLGSWIRKDPQAELTYSMEWVDWLPSGDSLATASYSAQVRANDPAPLVIDSDGIQGTVSYCSLSGGQVGKTYTITAEITTANGLLDRRSFRVKVENRSA